MGQRAGWGLADRWSVVFVIVIQLLVLAYLNAYLNVPIGIAGMVTSGVLTVSYTHLTLPTNREV